MMKHLKVLLPVASLLCACVSTASEEADAEHTGEVSQALTTDHVSMANNHNHNPFPGTCSFDGHPGWTGYTPATLAGHPTVSWGQFYDRGADCSEGASGLLSLTGFTADPGKSFISSVQLPGKALHTVTASTYYTYGGGTAIWEWVGSPFGFASSTNPVTATVVHN